MNDPIEHVYVYFISAGGSPIKIGVSDNPSRRLLDLQTAHYQKLYLLYTLKCGNRQQALEVESAFHRWYDELRIRNEWFKLTPAQVGSDVALLTAISRNFIELNSFLSANEVARLERKAAGKYSPDKLSRTADSTKRVIDHLNAKPEDATLTLRALGDATGVSKDTASRGLQFWKSQTDNIE